MKTSTILQTIGASMAGGTLIGAGLGWLFVHATLLQSVVAICAAGAAMFAAGKFIERRDTRESQ